MSHTTISVTGEAASQILVGNGLFELIPERLGSGVKKVLIVHTGTLGKVAEELRQLLSDAGIQALLAEVPDAESAKRVEVAAFCWQILGQADFTPQ